MASRAQRPVASSECSSPVFGVLLCCLWSIWPNLFAAYSTSSSAESNELASCWTWADGSNGLQRDAPGTRCTAGVRSRHFLTPDQTTTRPQMSSDLSCTWTFVWPQWLDDDAERLLALLVSFDFDPTFDSSLRSCCLCCREICLAWRCMEHANICNCFPSNQLNTFLIIKKRNINLKSKNFFLNLIETLNEGIRPHQTIF